MLRRPIYNPYDRFTQPEFDAWIGDITGALRRALGQTTDEPPHVNSSANDPYSSRMDENGPDKERDDLDDNSEVEDSFAEVKARRSDKGKGKERDPREGPGLSGLKGHGGMAQPIEIDSDSDQNQEEEDGEEFNSNYDANSDLGSRADDDEEDDVENYLSGDEDAQMEEEDDEFESPEVELKQGQSSAEVIELSSDEDEEDEDDTAPTTHARVNAYTYSDEDVDDEEQYDEEEEEQEDGTAVLLDGRHSSQAILYEDDDEDQYEEDQDGEDEDETVAPLTHGKPHGALFHDEDEVEYQDDNENEEVAAQENPERYISHDIEELDDEQIEDQGELGLYFNTDDSQQY